MKATLLTTPTPAKVALSAISAHQSFASAPGVFLCGLGV
jgi:hypothetical protein